MNLKRQCGPCIDVKGYIVHRRPIARSGFILGQYVHIYEHFRNICEAIFLYEETLYTLTTFLVKLVFLWPFFLFHKRIE